MSPRQVVAALDALNCRRAAFDRPLRMGDVEQMEIARTVAGHNAYCSGCFREVDGRADPIDVVGVYCRRCGHVYLPGAALEPRWRRRVGLPPRADAIPAGQMALVNV